MGDFRQDRRTRSGGGHGDGFSRRDGGRPNFPKKSWGGSGNRDRGPATMYQAVCDQCGKPCEVPFRPTDGKPVYCDVCFRSKKENTYKTLVKTDVGSNDELKKQLGILNEKMDQLIKTVEAITNTKPLVIKEKVKK